MSATTETLSEPVRTVSVQGNQVRGIIGQSNLLTSQQGHHIEREGTVGHPPGITAEYRQLATVHNVFPGAEHGILTFADEESGERRLIGYSPGYLPRQVEWLRQQSGLQ